MTSPDCLFELMAALPELDETAAAMDETRASGINDTLLHQDAASPKERPVINANPLVTSIVSIKRHECKQGVC